MFRCSGVDDIRTQAKTFPSWGAWSYSAAACHCSFGTQAWSLLDFKSLCQAMKRLQSCRGFPHIRETRYIKTPHSTGPTSKDPCSHQSPEEHAEKAERALTHHPETCDQSLWAQLLIASTAHLTIMGPHVYVHVCSMGSATKLSQGRQLMNLSLHTLTQ